MLKTYIAQYAVYILLSIIALLTITVLVLCLRVWSLNKDLALKAETIKVVKATLDQRDATIAQMGLQTQRFKQQVDTANAKALTVQATGIKYIRVIEQSTFPTDCQQAVDKAIELIPHILEAK